MPKPDPAEGSRVWTELYNIVDGVIDQAPMAWRVGPDKRPSDEYLAVNGFYGLIRLPAPSIDLRIQRLEMQAPKDWARNDVAHTVTQGWKVITLTPAEQAEVAKQQLQLVRQQRDEKLRQTDYTQLSDHTKMKTQWAAYRKALRDLPDTLTDPFNVAWPAPPSDTEV